MRFFWGSHFVLVGWEKGNFCIFYFGIGSAYPGLPIQVEVEIQLSIKMGPLGAPRPPATKISSPDMTRFPAIGRHVHRTILSRAIAATKRAIVVIPSNKRS